MCFLSFNNSEGNPNTFYSFLDHCLSMVLLYLQTDKDHLGFLNMHLKLRAWVFVNAIKFPRIALAFKPGKEYTLFVYYYGFLSIWFFAFLLSVITSRSICTLQQNNFIFYRRLFGFSYSLICWIFEVPKMIQFNLLLKSNILSTVQGFCQKCSSFLCKTCKSGWNLGGA